MAEVFTGEDFFFGAGGEDFAFVEEEDVGEGVCDFLNVMGDEDVIGGVFSGGGPFEEVEEMNSGNRIETGAGFVENEELDAGHEGSTNEYFLFFALGELAPECVNEMSAFDVFQNVAGFVEFFLGGFSPEVDHGTTASDQGPDYGFTGFDEVVHGGTDKAHSQFYLIPTVFAELLAQDPHFSRGGSHEGTQYIEHGAFAGTIGSQNGPMLTGMDFPAQILQQGFSPVNGDVTKIDNGFLFIHGWGIEQVASGSASLELAFSQTLGNGLAWGLDF